MDENKFWSIVWRTLAAVFSVLVLTIGGCTISQQIQTADLVKGGADPIAAHCAISGINSYNMGACTLAVKKSQ